MAGANHEAVRIVFIHTQYVVTDPVNFKSVVQNLTGKHSSVACLDEENSVADGERQREVDINRGGLMSSDASCPAAIGGADSRLSKGLSFKDLDRIILEQLTMEEWHQLLVQYNLL